MLRAELAIPKLTHVERATIQELLMYGQPESLDAANSWTSLAAFGAFRLKLSPSSKLQSEALLLPGWVDSFLVDQSRSVVVWSPKTPRPLLASAVFSKTTRDLETKIRVSTPDAKDLILGAADIRIVNAALGGFRTVDDLGGISIERDEQPHSTKPTLELMYGIEEGDRVFLMVLKHSLREGRIIISPNYAVVFDEKERRLLELANLKRAYETAEMNRQFDQLDNGVLNTLFLSF